MPADPTTPPRITVERIAALCSHYARMLRLAGWRFLCTVVPGLQHQGDDAWAVVDPDPRTRTARVQVRDIDETPIPGFDGDPLLEIRVTVAHELLHCVVAEAIAEAGGALSVPAEERIVETAAQAMVRSEGLDARVMARAVCALPSALRARVAASAGQRARGGTMLNMETLKGALDALKAGDGAKALEILEGIFLAYATGEGPDAAPSERAEAGYAAKPTDPGMEQTEPPMQARSAARKGEAIVDQETARARKEAQAYRDETKAIADDERALAKDRIVDRLRARLVGHTGLPAIEKRVLAAPDYQTAKTIADIALEMGSAATEQRARSGVEHGSAAPDLAGQPAVSAADLAKEGFDQTWISSYQSLHRRDPAAAAAELEGGREFVQRRARRANGAVS